MDISLKLPRFENEKALIIVCGGQTANFYLGENGHIKHLSFFRVHPQNYPGHEGYYQQRGTGVFNRGHFDETKDLWREEEFLTHFRDTVRVIIDHEKPTTIYLFAPQEIINKVKQRIPIWQRRKLKMTVGANLSKMHLITVLERIAGENLKSEKIPFNPEARKILDQGSRETRTKGEQANQNLKKKK